MKLWTVTKPVPESITPPWGYMSAYAFVVRADTEQDARMVAASRAGTEGRDVWIDPSQTLCTELTQEGDREVVLRDFLAG